jgi:hypothetical protein
VAGCGSYDEEPGGKAEVAFAVAERLHHQGIATLLLEHLVSAARSHGITTFTAQTLPENTPMLHLFAGAGLPVRRHYQDGVVEVTIPLPRDDTGSTLDTYLDTVARRERCSPAALLTPQSVAVIGASHRTGTARPRHPRQHPDRRLRATPMRGASRRLRQAGRKALAVITTGLDIPGYADLLATCRHHGMRLADRTGPADHDLVPTLTRK